MVIPCRPSCTAEESGIRAGAEAFDTMEPFSQSGTEGMVCLDQGPEIVLAGDALVHIAVKTGGEFRICFNSSP